MSTRIIKTVYAVDGETKYVDAVKKINKEQQLLRSELKAQKSAFDSSGKAQKDLASQADNLSKQIELQKQKIAEAQNAVEQSTKSYGENSKQTQEYKIKQAEAEAALGRLQTQLANTNKELLLNESNLYKAGTALESAGTKMETLGDKASKIGGKLTMGVTTPILALGTYATKSAMDFESAFAGVRKTVDATEEQFAELETGIRDMAKVTPTAAKDIAAVAESAGQLGIKTENILGFTRAMIDLGEATNLTSTEGAEQLAQFANITQMSQDNFDRLGSSIVALGNNSATTEKNIVNMGMRLAGAGKQANMSEADIMGIAAALSSVGIEAEAGGSAMSKVIVNMQLAVASGGESLREFADVAGMTSEEFANAYRDNAAGALAAFVTGLGGMEAEGKDAIVILNEMGITETRMRDALLRASGAGDLLTSSIQLSSEAWKENAALTKEAEQRYQTSESKIKMAKNSLQDAAITIGKNLLPPLADLAKSIANAADAFGNLNPKTQKTIIIAAGVIAAIGPVTKVVGNLTKIVGTATKGIGSFVTKLAEQKATSVAAKAASDGLTTSVGGSGGLTSVMNPAGIAIAAVTLAIGGLIIAMNESDRASREAGEAGKAFVEGIANWHDGVEGAKSALEGFNMETIISGEKMSELESKIGEVQTNIKGIAETAARESREYTDAEREEIENLIGLLHDYTEKKIEAYQQQALVVEAMVTQERDITLERAQELIKGAEDAKTQTMTIAQTQYMDRIALAEETYGHLGELDKTRYDAEVVAAQSEYDARVGKANQTYGDTLSIIQQKYAEYNAEDMQYIQAVVNAQNKIVDLENQKNADIKTAQSKALKDTQSQAEAAGRITTKYRALENEAIGELAKAYQAASDHNLDSWLGMVMQTELYGGKVSNETKNLVKGVTDSFSHLPQDSRTVMSQAMQGMLNEMQNKEPTLYNKASSIANGILRTLRKAFDEHSPSKKMEKITSDLWAGADKPNKEAEKKLPAKAEEIASSILSEASRMGEAELYLSSKVKGVLLNQQMRSMPNEYLNTSHASVWGKENNLANGDENTFNIKIDARGMIVRSKDDINQLSQMLAEEIKRKVARRGGRAS